MKLPAKVAEAIRDRDGRRCINCGDDNSGEMHDLHVHHIVSISDGGSDAPDNLVTLCGQCHRRAHTAMRLPAEVDTGTYEALSLSAAAKLIGVSSGRAWRLLRDGELSASNNVVGGHFVTPQSVHRYVRSRRMVLESVKRWQREREAQS